MSEVDGWAEMIDYIDEDDVKRWNADKKLDPQKFKGALVMAVKSDSMRLHLFARTPWTNKGVPHSGVGSRTRT